MKFASLEKTAGKDMEKSPQQFENFSHKTLVDIFVFVKKIPDALMLKREP